MKKLQALFALALFSIVSLHAQMKNLTVDVKFDELSSGVYKYQGEFSNKPYWVGPEKNNRYVICFSTLYNQWLYGQYFGDTNSLKWMQPFDQSSATNEYPITGWSQINVSLEGPTLKYTTSELKESIEDDGQLKGRISISHNKFNGQGFKGSAGADLVSDKAVEVLSLPAGLTAHAIVESDSVVDFYLEGNATDHAVDTALKIKFTDAAFINGGKADSTQGSNFEIKINWVNTITVAIDGGDYKTIQEGLNNIADGDILYIQEGEYTEHDLTPNSAVRNLTILGDGPNETVIQADETPYTAEGRVFNFQGLTHVFIKGITIQNGNVVAQGASGGAILAQSAIIEIENARILNNHVMGAGSSQSVGGGIFCSVIWMKNSEVVGNSCSNENKSGLAHGGAIAAQAFKNTHRIENSTIANNQAELNGGALGIFTGRLDLVNVTLANNATNDTSGVSFKGLGGGIWSQDSVSVKNSILYNNKGGKGDDIYMSNRILIANNSIIGDFAHWNPDTTQTVVGSYSKADPKLDTLNFNCSETRTLALLDGSPAIDAGDQTFSSDTTDQRGMAIVGKRDIGAHEANSFVQFEIDYPSDTICITKDAELIKLKAYPSKGMFWGEGTSGNTLDISKITKEGWVKITFERFATGCGDNNLVDSIYAKICEPNSTQNIELPVRMYPNPVQSELHFDLNASDLMDIQIMDISGKLVHGVSQVSPKAAVNVADLPNGLYFVKVVSGGRSAHMKFIKN